MPLVAHLDLPSFAALRDEGIDVVTAQDVEGNGLPSLRIGLLNLMPDAAIQATERQFLRLVDGYGEFANLYVIPFAVRAEYRAQVAIEIECQPPSGMPEEALEIAYRIRNGGSAVA